MESIDWSQAPEVTSVYRVDTGNRESMASLGDYETLQADYEALQHELERYKSACNEWLEKSEWVQETAVPKELGMHRADVMKRRVEALQTECEKLRKDAERYQWLRDGNNEENSEATIIAANFWGDRWDHMIDNAMEPPTTKEVSDE